MMNITKKIVNRWFLLVVTFCVAIPVFVQADAILECSIDPPQAKKVPFQDAIGMGRWNVKLEAREQQGPFGVPREERMLADSKGRFPVRIPSPNSGSDIQGTITVEGGLLYHDARVTFNGGSYGFQVDGFPGESEVRKDPKDPSRFKVRFYMR